MAMLHNMTRGQIARRAMLAAVLVMWIVMALAARRREWAAFLYLIPPALMMVLPTWLGAIGSARDSSSSTSGVATVATGVTFLLSLLVAYDIITSASSTAGIGFVFWPVIASVILGVVIGIGSFLAYLDDKRWP